MRKSHSILILGIFIATICASAFAADVQSAAPAGLVNINTADAAQLSLLPRVGMKAAQRIVDYRAQHGPFHKTTDLMQVKGFGNKSFERLNPYLTIDGKTTLTEKVRSPRKARANRKPSTTASK
ncbi:MAG TPA: ComEA family DNA-binding protein [Thermoanaerobaculia bacterium]